MSTKRPPGLFVVGTDTEVGKTRVACVIARQCVAAGLRVGVYKPAASGCDDSSWAAGTEDAQLLWQAAGQPQSIEDVCPQRFEAPLAPHLAARSAGREIDSQLLRRGLDAWSSSDLVVVEGIGGLMSPVTDDEYVADLAVDFGYPLIVVAANKIGVINQTLQTLISASTFRDGLDIGGIVLNRHCPPDPSDVSCQSNCEQLRRHCVPPVLGVLDWCGEGLSVNVDWAELAREPIRPIAPAD